MVTLYSSNAIGPEIIAALRAQIRLEPRPVKLLKLIETYYEPPRNLRKPKNV